MLLIRNLANEITDRLMLRVENEGGEEGGSGGSGEEGGEEKPEGKSFTQEQLNRHIAREKAATERKSKKDFEEWLAGQKSDQDKATMDEAARAKAEAEEAKAEGERLKAEGARERFLAKVERKLATAGVDAKAVERAVRLIDLDADASDDDITAEIESLKTDMPGLFAATSDGTTDQTGTDGAPSGVTTGAGAGSNNAKGGKSAMERGAELWNAKQQKSSTTAA